MKNFLSSLLPLICVISLIVGGIANGFVTFVSMWSVGIEHTMKPIFALSALFTGVYWSVVFFKKKLILSLLCLSIPACFFLCPIFLTGRAHKISAIICIIFLYFLSLYLLQKAKNNWLYVPAIFSPFLFLNVIGELITLIGLFSFLSFSSYKYYSKFNQKNETDCD